MEDTKDTNLALIPTSTAERVSALVLNKPEAVYDQLVKAEKWVKELKEMARKTIISRMKPELSSLSIDTDEAVILASKHRPSLKPDVIRAIYMQKGLNPDLVVYKTVVFEAMPTARDTIDMMLKSKLLTQAEYDSMFEKPKVVVTVKPKSSKSIVELDVSE